MGNDNWNFDIFFIGVGCEKNIKIQESYYSSHLRKKTNFRKITVLEILEEVFERQNTPSPQLGILMKN